MSKYHACLFRLDAKPRRKVVRSRVNRFREPRHRWFFPAILALILLGFFIVHMMR